MTDIQNLESAPRGYGPELDPIDQYAQVPAIPAHKSAADVAAQVRAEMEAAGVFLEPVTFDSLLIDIEAFTKRSAESAKSNKPVLHTDLEPIIFKYASLLVDRKLTKAQGSTLMLLILGSGVVGFSTKGNRGAPIVRDMLDEARLKILNERRTENWHDDLMRSETRTVIANEENAAIAVEHMFGDRLCYDRFSDEMMLSGVKMLDEHHFDVLTSVQRIAVPTIKPKQVRDAVRRACRKITIDSLQDYLTRLEWDGRSRVNDWMIRSMGVTDTPFHKAASRWFMIGAVARALRPGCKLDTALVFMSEQGDGKNKALEVLSGNRNLEFQSDFMTRDGLQELRGRWFIEMAEVSSLDKHGHKQYKAFSTRKTDRYRKAYDIEMIDYPRQFVLCGTSNPEPFLRDPTGDRRFWLAEILKTEGSTINLDSLEAERDQLWAEAVHLFGAGERWWPEPADRWFLDAQAEINAKWAILDAWQVPIEDYLMSIATGGLPPKQVQSATWLLQHVLCRKLDQISQADTNRLGAIMTKLGYRGATVWLQQKSVRGYTLRIDTDKIKNGWWTA